MATEKVNAEVVVEAKVKGVDKAAAEMNKLAAATEKATAKAEENVQVTDRQTKVKLSLANAVTVQLRKQDQEFRRLTDLERAEKIVDNAKKQGLATDEKVIRLSAILAEKRRELTGALNDNAQAFREVANAASALNARLGVRDDFNTAMRAADIAAYGAEMDRLRAKFSPLFAAQQAYRADLRELKMAFRTGAVGADEYASALERLKGGFAGSVRKIVPQRLDRDALLSGVGGDLSSYGTEMDRLRAKYLPLVAAQQQYKAQLDDLRGALHRGWLSEKEYAEALKATKSAFAERVGQIRPRAVAEPEATAAVNKEMDALASGMSLAGAKYRSLTALMSQSSSATVTNAKSVGLARHEITNLSQQMQDVVVSLGSGQTAMTVLLQQGSQVYDVLSRRQGGIASGVQALGQYLGGLASKATPAAGALAAVATAIGLVVAGVYRWNAAQEALTVSLNGLGRASGVTIDQANTTATVAARESGISVNAAQGYASQFLGAGVSGSNLRGGVGLVRDFARKLGLQEDEAAKTLAAAMADPARGAKELADKFGLLTRAQRRQVEETANAGDVSGAAAKLFGELTTSLERMKDPTSTLTALWDWLGARVSNIATALGREFVPGVGSPKSSEFDRQKALANRDQAALDKATDRLSGLLNIAQDADLAAKAITATTYAEREAVVVEKSRLESLRDSANALKINAEAEAERTRMLADATAKVNEFIRTTARTIESFGKTSYERGLLQIRQERQDLLRQVPRGSAAEPTPAPTPSRRYRGTHAGAYEASQRSGYTPEATSTFSGGLFLIDGQPAARPRPAPAPAPAAGLDRTVSRQSGALEAAYISDAQRSVLRAANDDLAAQNRLLDAQAASFGKSAGEAARLNKEQELLNQYTREHIPITAAMRQRIAETAEGWGLYAQRLEDVNKKNAALIESLDKVRGASTNAMSTFLGGLTRGDSVGAVGRKVLDQLMDTGLNNAIQGATDKLFGKAGTNGSDSILGGLFGSLFGQGQKTQQMTVTAANVIVNGKDGIAGAFDGAKGFLDGASSFGGGLLDSLSSAFSSFSSMFPFADGGIMTSAGPLPLRAYASGGVADSPQLALFGEGRRPEAFVPLPDGRSIPVTMQGDNAPKINIHNYAGVQVEARKNAAGEIEVLIDRKIAANNARLPGMLSDYDRRRA